MPETVKHTMSGNFPLDENIVKALPNEVSKVIRADSYGASAWNQTARIIVELADKSEKRFFVKVNNRSMICHEGERGKAMMVGEYESELEIHRSMPELIPKPYTWGKCKITSPPTYFILKEFCDMSTHLPEPTQFCAKLAKLHASTHSPTGKFGYHVPTFQGYLQQVVDWDDSWASFFSNLIAGLVRSDVSANGPWRDYEDAVEQTQKHVIPRLLGALESNGRSLKPVLIHGNLWEGNCGTSLETGDIKIFDAGSYYGHSEAELGIWRSENVRFRAKTYMRQYLRNYGLSEPADEFDDRNRLYCLPHNITHSIHQPGSYVREKALEDMLFLIDKYAPKESGDRVRVEV